MCFRKKETVKEKVKIAIIGCGGMGGNHLGRMTASGLFDVVGIYDIDPSVKKKADARHIPFFKSVDELFAFPGLQAVLIATPNDVHKEYAIAAAKHKLAVLCEKPVTMCCADLQDMLDAAKENGTLFSVHQNRRWDQDYLCMKKIVEEGKIGHVYKIESKVVGSHGIPGAWRKVKSQGGGMIFDWGVHLMDQILLFNQSPITSVRCTTSYVYQEEVDDGFELNLTFEDGMAVTIVIDTNSFVKVPRWLIYGMDGTAVIDSFNCHQGNVVAVKTRLDSKLKGVQAGNGFTKTMADRSKSTIKKYRLPRISDDGLDLYRNFCKCVLEKTPEKSIITGAQLMRVMKLIELSFESAEKNEILKTHF